MSEKKYVDRSYNAKSKRPNSIPNSQLKQWVDSSRSRFPSASSKTLRGIFFTVLAALNLGAFYLLATREIPSMSDIKNNRPPKLREKSIFFKVNSKDNS